MTNNSRLKEQLRDPDPYERRDACETIAETRCGDYLEELVALLQDEHMGVREAALTAVTAIGGKDVADAITPLLHSDDPAVRNIGIEVLEQIGPDALETISNLLNDPDDDVVKFGIDTISVINDPRGAEMLTGLVNHGNPNVRASALLCLGKLGAQNAVPRLMDALGDSEQWVRFSVIEGLGLSEDTRALGPLMQIIEKESPLLQEAAVEAVSRIATPGEAPGILNKLLPNVRKGEVLAAAAIVELIEKATMPGSNFKPGEEIRQTYFKYLTDALEDNELDVKKKAIHGLTLLKMPEAFPKVFEFAESFKEIDEETEAFLVDAVVALCGHAPLHPAIKSELAKPGKSFKIVVMALGLIRSVEAVPFLQEAGRKVGTHELREIVKALEEIASADSLPFLLENLESTDGHVRKTCARAVSRLGGEGYVEALFDAMVKEPYRDVTESMADFLATIPSPAVMERFYSLLSSDKELLREVGARGAGLIGDEVAVEYLKNAVADNSTPVRKVAYNSLAKLGVPEAMDTVIKGLKDPDDEIKLAVLKSLGGWSGEKITGALVESLKDENMWVRYNSMLLLGEMDCPHLEDVIIEVLANDLPPVKAAAAKTIEKLGFKSAIKVLEKFLDHPDPSLRAAVENALGTLTC